MGKREIDEIIELPEGLNLSLENNKVVIKGKEGEVSREFTDRIVSLNQKDNSIQILCKNANKKDKARAFAYRAHIKNMIKGVTEGHNYELKICSSHFPMNVAIDKGALVVKNFLGEKVPRKLKIKEGVDVKVDGSSIKVKSNSKEKAGQVAADIEQLCRITNKDKRIFQDGIYIINKDGKEVV